MDDADFIIPLQKEDLQQQQDGQYYVQKLLPPEKAFRKLKELRTIGKNGCVEIFKHFDTLYSCFCEKEIDFLHLHEIYDSAIHSLVASLKDYVESALKFDEPKEKKEAVNVITMILYIFSLFIKAYEEKLSHKAENMIAEPKRAKGAKIKGKIARPEDSWDWSDRKMAAFSTIYSILEMKINPLWTTAVADTQFVNMVANCCYKAFENLEVVQAKSKPLRDNISHVLAILTMHYNHGMTFIPKAVQLMKHHEHVASAISSTVILMVTEYQRVTVLPKILTELNDAIVNGEVTGLDKATSTFITDIAEAVPEVLIPSVNELLKNLIVEPYSVRNATLVAFTEILLHSSANKTPSEEEKELRVKLLLYLHNHVRDQNSYVRSKVLQLWIKLGTRHAIPKDLLLPLLATVKGRLNDKSCHTVKNAVLFFTTVLRENPCTGKLNINEIQTQLVAEKITLQALATKKSISQEEAWKKVEGDLILAITNHLTDRNEEELDELPSTQSISVLDVMIVITNLIQEKHFLEAYNLLKQSEVQFPKCMEIRCNMDDKDKIEYYIATLKKIFMNCINKVGTMSDALDYSDEYDKQCSVVAYVEETLEFAKLVTEGSKDIEKILRGKSLTEVLEAIEFFTVAFQFGVADSRRVLRSTLSLVKSNVPGVKEAVNAAYKKLYLQSSKPTPRGQAVLVSQRLIKLIRVLDLNQKSALGDLIHLWVENNEINKHLTQVLWEKFISKDNPDERLPAIILLDLLASANNSLVASNISVLIESGISDVSNLAIVEHTCNMLSKYGLTKTDGKYIRLYSDHELFHQAEKCLVDCFDKFPSDGYIPMSISVINMVFKLCCYPEKVTDRIVSSLYKIMTETSDREKSLQNSTGEDSEVYNEALLKRLLLIYSSITFRKFIFLDKQVVNCLKKDNNAPVEGNAANTEEDEDEDEKNYRRDNEECANEEVVHSVQIICENLVETNETLDSHLKDLVVKICKNYQDVSENLLSAAVVSLSKLMLISIHFCTEMIQLYVTIMNQSKFRVVRQNMVLGFGDLILRFPNLIEPWSPRLYGMLKDRSVPVRKNTVDVLNHLITREMIKVRGQFSEFCLCLEDAEPSIAENVQSLIIDLSQKGNTLYNIIPDVISRLSNREGEPLEVNVFNRIMKFILKLIGKERQNELLIDKLCTRIREADNERLWRDLSFCLSQLSFGERGLKKLCEALPHFKEQLMCREVYDNLIGILNSANKALNKPALKEVAIEGLNLLDELTTYKGDARKKKQKNNDSEDEEEDNEEDDTFQSPKKPNPPPTPKTVKTRSTRSAKKPKRN